MNRLICCVLLTLLAQTSLANQPAWYQVEMLMFAYTNPDQLAEEQWSVPEQTPASALTPPRTGRGGDGLGYFYKAAHLMSQAIHSSGLPVAPPLKWLKPAGMIQQNSLAWHAKKLNGQRDIKVLWHETWVEAVQKKPGSAIHPVNLMLSGEPEIHVTGGFGLHVGRYLHLKTDLTIQHIGDVVITEGEPNALAPQSIAPQSVERGTVRYAHFAQSRKMRSKELHYIDHPLMGIVIKLLPIKITN